VLPRFSINQEKKGKIKKKIVDLAYILFSCKINRPCAAAFRPAYICEFKKLARKKKKILFAKIRARNQKDNNVFAHCPTKYTNFSFFSAIFRMLRFSKREKSTEKKINER
jgi:hypothetical protein